MEDNSNQDTNMKIINESDCRLDINNYQNFEVISRCEFGPASKPQISAQARKFL